MKTFTAAIKRERDWWIGWIEEVPGVNAQERTEEALKDSLRSALEEAIRMNRQDALEAAGDDYREEEIALAG